MDSDIVQKVREIVIELSARGTCSGEVNAGSRRRADKVRQDLVLLFNEEQEFIATTGQRLPTAKGVILKSMIQHLVAAVWGRPSFSPEQKEQAIQAAAKAIPELCDKLQAMPDSSVLSPNKSENEGTTEGTKNITSGDTADNSEKKSKRKFCDKCKRLKENWLNKIRRTKEDIPLQTFLKEFFANPALPDIWKKNGRGEKKPTTWEAMEKKFRANENDWKPEYTALIEELRGTLGGH
jgi:hypothetical protein